ncbi:uncharacterized protein LOC144904865 [Branchiostoma floridae x Branchiostoma belcheri]
MAGPGAAQLAGRRAQVAPLPEQDFALFRTRRVVQPLKGGDRALVLQTDGDTTARRNTVLLPSSSRVLSSEVRSQRSSTEMTGPLTFSLLVALSCSVLVGSEKLPAYDPADYRPGEAEDWKQTWRELLHSILPDRTVSYRHYGRRAALGLPGKRAEPTLEPRGDDDDDYAVMERSVRRRVPLFGFPGKRTAWNVLEEEEEKKAPFALPGKRAPFALPGKRAPFALPGKRAPFSLPGKRGEETQDDLVPEEWAFPVQPVLSMPSRRAPSLALPGKR